MKADAWYALHVLTGREDEIGGAISARELASPLIPTRIVRERRRGKQTEVRRVLFPGYVFIRWDASVAGYYEINAIPGVIRFVGMNAGRPAEIPEDQMAPVMILANRGNPIAISQAYREGDRIRIRSGPLKDLEAYIVRINPRNGRAAIQIPLLSTNHTVQLGIEMLEPTSTPEYTQADSSPRIAMGDQG